jgi:CPA2 family monovalent cation:H+ antiporter-2
LRVLARSLRILRASALTTFTTPYLIRSRKPLGALIEKLIPVKAQNFLGQYSRFSSLVQARSEWRGLVRHYVYRILINTIVIVAIFIIAAKLSLQFRIDPGLTIFLALILASPFFWGILFYASRDPELAGLIQNQLSKGFRKFLFLVRLAFALILLSALVGQLVSFKNAIIVTFAIFVMMSFLMSRYLGPVYIWFESRFLKQLNRQQKSEIESSVLARNLPTLAP